MQESIRQCSELYKIQLTFKSYENEKFYGMGQYVNGQFNLKGSVLELAQKHTNKYTFFLEPKLWFILEQPCYRKSRISKQLHTLDSRRN